MVQDLSDGDERRVVHAVDGVVAGPVAAEVGGDRLIEVDQPLLNELQHERGRHGLGDRCPAVVIARIGAVAGGDVGETCPRGDLDEVVAARHDDGSDRAGGAGGRGELLDGRLDRGDEIGVGCVPVDRSHGRGLDGRCLGRWGGGPLRGGGDGRLGLDGRFAAGSDHDRQRGDRGDVSSHISSSTVWTWPGEPTGGRGGSWRLRAGPCTFCQA